MVWATQDCVLGTIFSMEILGGARFCGSVCPAISEFKFQARRQGGSGGATAPSPPHLEASSTWLATLENERGILALFHENLLQLLLLRFIYILHQPLK